ncbi:hypothetical protein DFR58_10662 [Anaerobacterium chartisolvens]|uniref:Uncharacterized protein n=1 Tax=Anaerobacterium chartisolvens TaxID=1297424 RepID=A0A369BDZ8_9FIRM|nr:hypothetical protein [Anaerobacterium chartisolvens]RCX17894.1 hypothetical protein DFR58_10662 [Anaerobacterium chartisolvens]
MPDNMPSEAHCQEDRGINVETIVYFVVKSFINSCPKGATLCLKRVDFTFAKKS